MDSSCKRVQYPKHDFCRLPLPSGRNQFINEVIPMNGSKAISPRRVLTFIAMLSAAMVTTLLVPAHAQQEVDPTWYDPYAVPNTVAQVVPAAVTNTVVAHSSQPAVAFHRHRAAVTTVSSAEGTEKVRGKETANQPKIADIGTPRDRSPEEQVAAILR
jgi:hypothetical protein